MMTKLRAIAFYLPQFHTTPENDKWWGVGFTEWTNVTKARPQFKGHYQPHLPADLGFYDLRSEEVREAQANLARSYGIYGFCYYHYWFNGRRMLEMPLNKVLETNKPDFPFCICWANESWKRNWDSQSDGYLIKQEHSEADDKEHIFYLLENIFSDKRYICVEGKPVFLIYKSTLFPDIRKSISIWRRSAKIYGFKDLYLCRVESVPGEEGDPSALGFDAAIDFQPDWNNLGQPLNRSFLKKIIHKLKRRLGFEGDIFYKHKVYDYEQVKSNMLKRELPPYKRFPGIFPSWDNSSRRTIGANIIINSSPSIYQDWLDNIVKTFVPFSSEENFLFIDAWNEWAEGNHLEACLKWGRAYLEATQKVLGTWQKSCSSTECVLRMSLRK